MTGEEAAGMFDIWARKGWAPKGQSRGIWLSGTGPDENRLQGRMNCSWMRMRLLRAIQRRWEGG